ncbi:MAG: PhzF family phenazine biosynthesis protein [Ignavibacteriales bacterium]|nr:PhzF family phenazine biosynthesis protein [Ignavibacteriales bacterium]
MKIKYYTCDVFTNQRFGGNQLAIFPDATQIPDDLLQSIAKEFNFSETTFVYPSNKLESNSPKGASHAVDSVSVQTRRVRIFTPGNELPFAGHPTIGTAIVLATTGAIKISGDETKIILEEGAGPIPVTIRFTNGAPSFAQLTTAKLPEFSDKVPSPEMLAMMLTVSRNDLDDKRFPVQFVSVGFPFLFVAVKNREVLKRVRANVQVIEELQLKDLFVFAADAEQTDFHFRARMFAPLIGIPEDPATGSACASFAGYLAAKDERKNGTLKWNIEQGFEMGRPSLLYIEADKKNDETTAIRVGGNAVMMMEGEIEI